MQRFSQNPRNVAHFRRTLKKKKKCHLRFIAQRFKLGQSFVELQFGQKKTTKKPPVPSGVSFSILKRKSFTRHVHTDMGVIPTGHLTVKHGAKLYTFLSRRLFHNGLNRTTRTRSIPQSAWWKEQCRSMAGCDASHGEVSPAVAGTGSDPAGQTGPAGSGAETESSFT